ncbi:ClpXP protease specificity-enhancing factor [Tolumonas lignilytica]|uniref:ClpXP protease specificity-enhancing factor n=1 Tax=Tolumonas lignilytica TaxID=1283284 RepID=UPI000464324B|nr:ClpXP protease specificity-enhancing factor [Tolumonas lignilytica]
MTPTRPYLLRAFYEWLLDNDMTPHLLVDANARMVQVPQQYARDGQIVLNIAPQAVVAFTMDNEAVSFNARFGGVPQQVYIPMAAVLAIHSRENGAGTFFPPEPAYAAWQEEKVAASSEDKSAVDDDDPQPPRPEGRPTLRVIK